jgi:hypothetical protein
MNPYETPKQVPRSVTTEVGKAITTGRPCDHCGSSNTGEDKLSRVAPNPILFLLFGWFFLLVKAAFSKKTDLCRDCGQASTYKTVASKIALAVLIALTALIAIAFLGEA